MAPREDRVWDAVVVGAGPAGCASAIALARAGAGVLVLEKSRFPRDKACGCCVGGAAEGALADLGLSDLGRLHAAPRLRSLRLRAARGAHAAVALHGGFALSRTALDAALADGAAARGAEVRFGWRVVGSHVEAGAGRRVVVCEASGERFEVAARVVLGAEGLARRLCRAEPGVRARSSARSRVGVAGTSEDRSVDVPPGEVVMTTGRGGYVGMVRLECGRVRIGAALDPRMVRSVGAAGACAAILREGGAPAPGDLGELGWCGVGALTGRAAPPGAERLLLTGDAAGYVEPFTGEGIGWALASGVCAAGVALGALERGWRGSDVAAWHAARRGLLGRRERRCAVVCALTRGPFAGGAAVRIARAAPRLVGRVVKGTAGPLGDRRRSSNGTRGADGARHGRAAAAGTV